MSLPPEKFNEAVLLALFSLEMNEESEGLEKLLMQKLSITKKYALRAIDQANELLAQRNELDKTIDRLAIDYDLDRINPVEKSIIRYMLKLYELQTLDSKGAIREGIRLAKKFSTKEASKFVHGLLSTAFKDDTNTSPSTEAQ